MLIRHSLLKSDVYLDIKSIKALLAIVKQVFLDELRKLLGSNEAFVVDSLGEVLAVSG